MRCIVGNFQFPLHIFEPIGTGQAEEDGVNGLLPIKSSKCNETSKFLKYLTFYS